MDSVYRFDPAKVTEKYHIREYFDKIIETTSGEEVIDEDEAMRIFKIRNSRIEVLNCLDDDDSNDDDDDDDDNDDVDNNDEDDNEEEVTTSRTINTFELPPGLPEISALKKLKNLAKSYAKANSKKKSINHFIEFPINHTEIFGVDKAEPGKDIVISVRIYNPFVADSRHGPSARRKITLSRSISILGRQTLAELRDKINCLSDLSVSYESSNNPSAAEYLQSNKKLYKSGFFYIENVFYNDMRDKKNKDNTAVIRQWAEGKNFGPFYVAKMEETRVDSLAVRFGYPWVYQHQGNCEHLIVFNEARLLNADDHLAVVNYPRVDKLKCLRNRTCMLCAERPLYWITIDSDRVPHNPCYFCKRCFDSYNYIDEKKIGNFKAYKFPCDPDIINAINCKSKSTSNHRIELMDQS